MDFIPVGNKGRKQKVSSSSMSKVSNPFEPEKDPNLNMDEIAKMMPGADPKLIEAAVNHMLQKGDKFELGKRASEEHDSPPLKKSNAEASTSQLVAATENPCQPLALTELTQAPPSQTPTVDLTKSGDEMSDTGASLSLL